MDPDGPDMDLAEQAARDPAVKGMWCAPKYSNPDSATYSGRVVARLAAMETAVDLRIFWDNAYIVRDLYENAEPLADLYDAGGVKAHMRPAFPRRAPFALSWTCCALARCWPL